MAKKCEGLIQQPDLPYEGDMRSLQAPQAPEDRHCSHYDNDTNGWVRGMPSAEAKPSFDKHRAGR